MTTADHIARRLDDATSDARILEHPFYEAWRKGALTRDDLAFYAGQYWRQVEAFPGYLEALAERLPEDAAAVVRANLADEIDGDHQGMWLAFAEAVGADRDAVHGAHAEAETRACVEAFATAAKSASPSYALGMIFGYESQTPEVAETKAEGLRGHYGVDGPGVEYFTVHGEIDVEHASELAGTLASVATTDSELNEAEAGARAGAEAIWRLLDGVTRARSLVKA
ncbi:MAG TPA: iron-containing redox enzyme family protein [Actinomycetota bacterium]|jgi:pyrroloquinoline-quinone synthase